MAMERRERKINAHSGKAVTKQMNRRTGGRDGEPRDGEPRDGEPEFLSFYSEGKQVVIMKTFTGTQRAWTHSVFHNFKLQNQYSIQYIFV